MTDLDTRLHALADDPTPSGAPLGELRQRADRRRRRRRVITSGVFAAVVLVGAAVAAAIVADDPQPSSNVRSGPSTTDPAPSEVTTTTSPPDVPRPNGLMRIGGFDEGRLTVSPAVDLADGQEVEVAVRGTHALGGATVVICAADVTAETAASRCDLASAGTYPSDPKAPEPPTMRYAVPRVLPLGSTEPETEDTGYDCATEPAGCVLAVGLVGPPVEGLAVPVSFRGGPLPTPEATATPTTGLQDGDVVEVTASGLRPNTEFIVRICEEDGDRCDESADLLRSEAAATNYLSSKSDEQGRLRYPIRANAALYDWKGRFDCTQVGCAVAVLDRGLQRLADTPIAFAADVVAPTPELHIDEPGPYRDDQQVTVRGTGFPPGIDLSAALGICPADKDPAVEERCGYSSIGGGPVVAADGTFETRMRLFDSLAMAGSCIDNITGGCYLGWILNHGPAAAELPLEFVR